MNDRATWYRIRHEMFEQVLAEVRERLGPEKGELRSYRESFEKDLARRWKVSDRKNLLEESSTHSVLLFADFHALQQSQKTNLRLLHAMGEVGVGPFVLALECIGRAHQKSLDSFMKGQLSEKEFLKRVRWKAEWGFPWENYRPLLQWAKKTGTPVIALNEAFSSLARRDRAAAKAVAEARKTWPDRRVAVVYGDLHLAADRLPAVIHKLLPNEAPPLRIFQNVESASLRLLKKGIDHQVEVIRYDRNSFAVLSVAPWVKWQNYLLWLDQTADAEIGEGEGRDLTDPVAAMVKWLSRELKVEVDPGGLTVYTAGDPDLWSRIEQTTQASERPWLEMMIEDGRSFYLSNAGWGYLARPSVNHAASLAMQYVHDRLCGGAKLGFKMPMDFQKMIWIEAVAYFGSKIINPKRKSDTLVDIRSSLSSRQSDDKGREALRLALSQKMNEMMALSGRASPKGAEVRPRRRSSWMAAASLLGALSGERLYHGYRRRLLSRVTLHSILKKPLNHDRFGLIYQELLEIIEALPAPFLSKKEKL